MNLDNSQHGRLHGHPHHHGHGHGHPLQPVGVRPGSAALNSVEGVPTAELRQAVRQLQSAINTGFEAHGVMHAPSWRFPSACAAEVSVDGVLDRYSVDVPDPRHAATARSALLELVVDRAVLLAEATLHHLDIDTPGDTDAHDTGTDAGIDPGGGHAATGAAPSGGIATIARLCEAALRLQSSREDLYLSLENKDAALDQMDAEVDRLAALAACTVDSGTSPQAEVVTQITRTCTTAVAAVQTDPEGRPRSFAKDCDDLRRAVRALFQPIPHFDNAAGSALSLLKSREISSRVPSADIRNGIT